MSDARAVAKGRMRSCSRGRTAQPLAPRRLPPAPPDIDRPRRGVLRVREVSGAGATNTWPIPPRMNIPRSRAGIASGGD
jgi:hypothetical protein